MILRYTLRPSPSSPYMRSPRQNFKPSRRHRDTTALHCSPESSSPSISSPTRHPRGQMYASVFRVSSMYAEWEATERKLPTGGHVRLFSLSIQRPSLTHNYNKVRIWDPKTGKSIEEALRGYSKWKTWEPT